MVPLDMSSLGPDSLRPRWLQVQARYFAFSFVEIKSVLSVERGKVLYDCVLSLICYGYKKNKPFIFLLIGNLPFSSPSPQQEGIAEKVVILGEGGLTS